MSERERERERKNRHTRSGLNSRSSTGKPTCRGGEREREGGREGGRERGRERGGSEFFDHGKHSELVLVVTTCNFKMLKHFKITIYIYMDHLLQVLLGVVVRAALPRHHLLAGGSLRGGHHLLAGGSLS